MTDSPYEDGREFEIGDTKKDGGKVFICTAVSYKEEDGVKYDFTYTWESEEEIKKREAAEKA